LTPTPHTPAAPPSAWLIDVLAARATINSEFVHNKPFPVAANMVADAIMAADAAGS
jgi:hypothetical protein